MHVWATAVSAATVLKIGLTLRWTKTRNWTNSLEALMRNYSGLYINGDEPKGSTTRELVNITFLCANYESLHCLVFLFHSQQNSELHAETTTYVATETFISFLKRGNVFCI